MTVKDLIIQLLNEDMDNNVMIKTKDNDVIEIDGILSGNVAPSHLATFLSTDCDISRFGE